MRPRLLAVLSLVASWVILLSPPAAFADPAKEAELLKRIEQLEKRVAELEEAIKALRPSGKEPATETEKKLIGHWTIADNDKKTAADKKIFRWADLNFKADGTCALLSNDREVFPLVRDAKYQVTVIGKVTRIEVLPLGWGGRIASVTETELVLEYFGGGDAWEKVHYTRQKK